MWLQDGLPFHSFVPKTFAFISAGPSSGAGGGIAFLLLAVLLAVVGTAAYFYRRQLRQTTAAAVAAKLFEELCRVHRLSDGDRALLARAAAGTTHTSIVFVDPTLLDRLGESHPDEAAACTRLRERLFGA